MNVFVGFDQPRGIPGLQLTHMNQRERMLRVLLEHCFEAVHEFLASRGRKRAEFNMCDERPAVGDSGFKRRRNTPVVGSHPDRRALGLGTARMNH